MKKLIFVDNDSIEVAKDTLGMYVRNSLEYFGGLDEKQSSSIEIISNFYKLEREKIFDLAFNQDNVIITWSVYTRSMMTDSGVQFISLLRIAGQSDVEGCSYIDVSGELSGKLSRVLRDADTKGVVNILRAIETNNIITRKDNRFGRIRVSISNRDIIYFEPINLNDYI